MGIKEGTGQLRNAVTGDLYIGEFKKDKFNGKVNAIFITVNRVN
jgi:hypothetical protein